MTRKLKPKIECATISLAILRGDITPRRGFKYKTSKINTDKRVVSIEKILENMRNKSNVTTK